MKKILLLTSLVLSFATAGMFAATAAEPVQPPSAQTQNAPAKTVKHKHKKHAKHHKKAAETKKAEAK